MALLQRIRRIFYKKVIAPAMPDGNTAVKNLLTSDEVELALEGFWNGCQYIRYEVRHTGIPSQNKCCQQTMQTFVMSSTIYDRPRRNQTIHACLVCGSCQYEKVPKHPAGYLINLREEQRLQTEFPERYREYRDYLNRFAAEGICLIRPQTFKEFFFRKENHEPRPEIISLLEGSQKYNS